MRSSTAEGPDALTSFVGRDRDVAILVDAIAHHRLITVTGPGGVIDPVEHSTVTVRLTAT